MKMKNQEEPEDSSQQEGTIDLNEEDLTIYIYLDGLGKKLLCPFERYLNTCRKLFKSAKVKTKTVTIKISTDGGDIHVGFAIHDLIVTSGLLVTTIAIGDVSSAGLPIFLAGNPRLIYPHAVLMTHKTDHNLDGSCRFEKDNSMKQLQVLDKMTADIIRRNSRLTYRQIKNLWLSEKFITAEEAVKYGLADGIIGK